MGRYINCKINGQWEPVWKYGFGAQSAEMYRIYEELGLGEYHPVCIQYVEDKEGRRRVYEYLETRKGADGDVLILNQRDAEELVEWLEVLKENCKTKKDQWFVAIVEATYKFMVLHSDQEEIVLEGDF